MWLYRGISPVFSTGSTLSAAIFGTDGFSYSDGDISQVSTVAADGWARLGTEKSDWSGDASVASGKLSTNGTSAWRAFGDPRGTAAFQAVGGYFFKAEFVYDGASEVVVSSSDFGTSKIRWGVINATGFFGIEVLDTSGGGVGLYSSTLQPVLGQAYSLVGMLDFDDEELKLWVNPEPSSESTPLLTVTYTGSDWSSGIKFDSSADGTGVLWDDIEVADDFTDLNLPVITPPFTLPELTISEFMASNTQTIDDPEGKTSDWIEILNATGSAVDLAGWYLTDNPSDLTKWTFPAHSLPHNSRILVWASGKDRTASAANLHTNFKLSAGDEYLALVKPDGVTIVKDYIWGSGETVPQQFADISYGTFGDTQDEDYFAMPTPGAGNVESPFTPFSGVLKINEIVATAAGTAPSTGITDAGLVDAPTFSDWIEIHNPGTTALDISGCRLTDDPNRKARWRFPVGTSIPAGGYLVVLADSVDLEGDYLHTNFSLGASGDYLGLYDPNGVLLDELGVEYPKQVAGYSYGPAGYYATPTPEAANGGTALSGIVAAPVFSAAQGFHDTPVTTTASSATVGATVHTEIGSAVPDQSSPTTVTFSSTAGQVLLIRARAYAPGMVPSEIVSATYIMNASAAEKSLPAMHFIGDDYTTFWDPAGGGSNLGIIDNYIMRGREWERPINLELHYPDGTPSEALNAGVRYAGHGDRPQFFRETNLWDYPFARPQFNLFFRGEYGEGSWDSDLLGDLTDVTDHDSLRVRLDLGLVDEFIRRLWVDMGNRGSVGTLNNLYINGVLRTVANPVQRIREPLLQEWYNTSNEFDVLAVFDFPSGTETAYSSMEDYFEDNANDFTQLATYQAGGDLLDYTNYADYMLLLSYMGTTDWPGNNKHAARERTPGGKFRFYVWDAQQSMTDGGAPPATEATIDRLLTVDDTTIKILSAVKNSEEFRLLWADRIQKHFFNGGALTNSEMDNRWFGLSNAINPIFDQMFTDSIDDSLYTDWRDTRLPHILANYETHGLWFDDLLAPAMSQQGGVVDGSSSVTLSNPTTDPQFTAMSVYYTMDGSDPRLPGGTVNSTAMVATAPLNFSAGKTLLRSRTYDATTDRWSPSNEAEFEFIGSTISLVVSEIFYNPTGQEEGEEFIELLNTSTSNAIDLSGFSFTNGISFTFPAGTILAPGARLVVAKDIGIFTSTYGTPPAGVLFGPYGGSLDNGGERVALSTPAGSRVIDFAYNDSSTWPQLADGDGRSLQLVDPASNLDPNLASSWVDGSQEGGSPGYIDTMIFSTWMLDHQLTDGLGDSDGDGMQEVLEYAFGSDPESFNVNSVIDAVDESGFLTIKFHKNLAASDVTYVVELSDNLNGWNSGVTETVHVSSERNGDGTSTETHRSQVAITGLTRKFIRVRVVAQ